MTATLPVREPPSLTGLDLTVRRPASATTETTVDRPRRRPATWILPCLDGVAALLVVVFEGTARDSTTTPSPLTAVAWLALLAAAGVYRTSPLTWSEQVRRICLADVCLAALLPLAPNTSGARSALTATLLGASAVTVRALAHVSDRWFGTATAGSQRIVVAGHRREVDRIIGELSTSTFPRFDVVGVVGTGSGDLTRIGQAVAQHRPDAVLVVPCRHVNAAAVRRLGWLLEGYPTRLMLATSLLDVSPSRVRLAPAGPLHLMDVRQPTLGGGRRLLKEVLERVLAAVALVLLLPVLVVVAVVIRIESEGSVLFRQTRVGKNGDHFTMWKLRSMCSGADQAVAALRAVSPDGGILFKLPSDPRVTRVGRVLRRYSIDELPQLVNVLTGDMSLVGPRPALPEEVMRYPADARRRLAVKPGITGLWQVSGRSDLSWEQTVRLDLRYVDNWSLRGDLMIMLRTLHAVVSHRGAY